MHKVLIADASEQWRELLEQALRRDYRVYTSCDGLQTLELLQTKEPDVLVMDLMLSGTDGLSILKMMEDHPHRPRVFITGRYFSNFVTASLEKYQVDHAILKPCTTESIADRIGEVLASAPEVPMTDLDPYDHITGMLVDLGVPTSQQGFRFLRSGILLLMEKPNQQLTKELYPAIARAHNTSPANVEKGLRTTVTAAWTNRRDTVWLHYFAPAACGQIPRPTAGQFLIRLAEAAASAERRRA